MEGKEVTINAPAHSKSGVRIRELGYEDHIGTKTVSAFDVARFLALMYSVRQPFVNRAVLLCR
eukprot:2486020-Pleurochrysis_carterae.AAC.1